MVDLLRGWEKRTLAGERSRAGPCDMLMVVGSVAGMFLMDVESALICTSNDRLIAMGFTVSRC